ncbi:hypothetical protein [Azospirillum himalayense]|uniref:Uncharacterized protein n=1 Tax=Azospirillum himalayense TaxID=654847 RepID=A0ABW0G954_9PROT
MSMPLSVLRTLPGFTGHPVEIAPAVTLRGPKAATWDDHREIGDRPLPTVGASGCSASRTWPSRPGTRTLGA